MRYTDIAILWDHLYWVRDRVLRAAEDPAVAWDADATGTPTVRDLRATLLHEVDAERVWRRRLTGPDPTRFPSDDVGLEPGDAPTVAALRDLWVRDEAAMRAWLATLSDERLSGPCGAEVEGSHPLWYHLQHLYAHAIQQFSDAATALTAMGHSPGDLEFLTFLDDRTTALDA